MWMQLNWSYKIAKFPQQNANITWEYTYAEITQQIAGLVISSPTKIWRTVIFLTQTAPDYKLNLWKWREATWLENKHESCK